MWLRNGNIQAGQMLFEYGNNDLKQKFGIYTSSAPDNKLYLHFHGFGAGNDYQFPTAFSLQGWFHIALTYDGADVKLYINGQHVGTTAKTLSTRVTNKFYFGNFNGAIDDLRIYSRALSDNEILYIKSNYETDDCVSELDGDSPIDCSNLIAKFFFNDDFVSENNHNLKIHTSNESYPNTLTAAGEGKSGKAFRVVPGAERIIPILKNDNGELKPHYLPEGNEERTVALWFKNNGGTTSPNIIYYGESADKKLFALTFASSGKISVSTLGANNSYTTVDEYDLSKWVHLGITYDGSILKLFVNGIQALSENVALETAKTNILKIGGYNGALDDLRIYDKALTPDEIYFLVKNVESNELNCAFEPELEVEGPSFDTQQECDNLLVRFDFNDTDKAVGNPSTEVVNENYEQIVFSDHEDGKAIVTTADTYKIANIKKTHNGDEVDMMLPSGKAARSFSLWFRIDNPGTATLFQYGNNSAKNRFLAYITRMSGASTYYALHFDAFGAENAHQILAAFTFNGWNHIVYTYDGSKVEIYVNGVYRDQFEITLNTTETNKLYFGKFDGAMDDIRVYDKVLSIEEITYLYNNFETEICPEVAFADPETDCEDLLAKFYFDSENESGLGFMKLESEGGDNLTFDDDGVVGKALKVSEYESDVNIIAKKRVQNYVFPYEYPSGVEPRTVSMWLKVTDITEPFHGVFNYGTDNDNIFFGSYFSATGSIYFQGSGGGNDYKLSGAYNLSDWNHLAITYDGARIKFYVNGVLDLDQEHELETSVTDKFSIGGFNGFIDDLRIYKRALTQTEVTDMFENPEVDMVCGESSSTLIKNSKDNLQTVYPIPASDVLYVSGITETELYSIADLSGRVVLQGVIDEFSNAIDVSKLASGYYVLQLSDGGVFKLILKK